MASTFLSDLADRVGVTASAKEVFGEPVQRNGITVIPIARARWGFGGGAGNRSGEEGAGGGGGATVRPVGYIELREDGSRFRRIVTTADLALLALVAGAVGYLFAHALGGRR